MWSTSCTTRSENVVLRFTEGRIARRYSPGSSRTTSRECNSAATAIQRRMALPSPKVARKARQTRRRREVPPPRASGVRAQRTPSHTAGTRLDERARALRDDDGPLAEDSEHSRIAVQVMACDLAAREEADQRHVAARAAHALQFRARPADMRAAPPRAAHIHRAG